ncbi:MAG TPA: WecB/TagA/CpsF family glycosyltransferase [Patescibacteria group bacterium]|nr:WecB/TagA/CpsF family glycosyltransferase [Patescibacteria group bacterium]
MTSNSSSSLVKIDILGVGITNASEGDILEYAFEALGKNPEKIRIVTPNPEIIVFAAKHPQFKNILNNAQISLADGVGVMWASSILAKPLKQRISGVDFMKKLCEKCAEKPITVSFLGAGPGIAEITAECLKKQYPGLKVGFAVSEIPNTKYQIPNTDILFVAYGFPKQEEWIAKHLPDLPVGLAMGVGGAFNEIAGIEKSPPKWIDSIGFKWLWRLVHEPWRWRRQLALLEFIGMVIREKFQNLNSKHQ